MSPTMGQGGGFFIYPPGATLAEVEIPHTRDANGKEAVLTEARAAVDRLIEARA
jgi:hypothetical protein